MVLAKDDKRPPGLIVQDPGNIAESSSLAVRYISVASSFSLGERGNQD